MRQQIKVWVIFLVLLYIQSVTVCAEDRSRNYTFELSANGVDIIQANTGDVITLTLKLKRTDSTQPADMYGMQDEIMYDSGFLELLPDSIMTAEGLATAELELREGCKALYVNYVSMTGGQTWEAEKVLGTFSFKVIGTGGISMITNENYLISCKDGKEAYAVSAVDVCVLLSTECIVTFQSFGGSTVPKQAVQYGEKIKAPEEPVRGGYLFTGWYRDVERTQQWDFEKDIVKGNITLYAGWKEMSEPAERTSEEAGELSGAIEDPDAGDDGTVWLIWLFLLFMGALLIYMTSKKYYENKHRK